MAIKILEFCRMETNLVIHNCIQSGLSKLAHSQEPLGTQARLYHLIGALRITYFILIIFNLHKVAGILKVFFNFFANNKPVLTDIKLSGFAQSAVVIKDINIFKIVTHPNFVVVDIVRRGYFQTTCSKLHIHIIVLNNWNGAIN